MYLCFGKEEYKPLTFSALNVAQVPEENHVPWLMIQPRP